MKSNIYPSKWVTFQNVIKLSFTFNYNQFWNIILLEFNVLLSLSKEKEY